MHIGLEQANAHIKTSNTLSLHSVCSWLVRHENMCISNADVSSRMGGDLWMEFWLVIDVRVYVLFLITVSLRSLCPSTEGSNHLHSSIVREGVEKDSKEENNEKEYKEAKNKPLKLPPHNELKRLIWG